MTTLRSPGVAGGAIGPNMKMTHLLKWVGQIGMDYKTLPSHTFAGGGMGAAIGA
jgi:hypothetical protein